MENGKTIQNFNSPLEAIDVDKLKIVFRSSWLWLILIFLAVNLAAWLYIRYTKGIYESSSALKLDVKKDATDLGIKNVADDPNVNLIAGEIELIQSELFLSRVLDSSNLEISYFGIGNVLNSEAFPYGPVRVEYTIKKPSAYNLPIYFDPVSESEFDLRLGDEGASVRARYKESISTDAVDLIVHKNPKYIPGDEIGYYFIIHSRDVLIDYLRQNLTAEPINYNANTVRLAFTDHNPYKAHAILNKIDTIYLQYSNEQKNLANLQKIGWLSNELALIEKRMEGFENYFENFTLQNKTVDLDQDLMNTIKQINRVDSQRYELSQRVQRLNQLLDNFQSGAPLASLSQRQSLPDRINEGLDRLQQLLSEQDKLSMSYTEVTFAFKQKQKEIEALKGKLNTQVTEVKADALRKLQQLNQQKDRLEKEFANLPDKSTEFSKNLRFYKLNEQLYLTLMQSKAEFEVTQAGSTPDFKILSAASFPKSPISPKKAMIAGAAFVISLVFIIGFVGLSYMLNNKIVGLSELERITDVPMLGAVPAVKYRSENGLHTVRHPKSMVSEAIRTLRTNLEFFKITGEKKAIAVSSTVSGEGKSFIAMNLGATIALSKKKVILLDLDLRKPKTNLPASIDDSSKGISTILIGKNHWIDCIIRSELENFHYIPSGPHPPNPSELLMNGEFAALLDELKVHYDYVIMDTPPVGVVTDGIMAMKQADLSIYVFRANYSKKEFLLNLKRIININKFRNITMVLNALPSTGKQSYGYGYYEEPSRTRQWKQLFKV